MPPTCRQRPTIRCPTPGSIPPGPEPAPAPAPVPNNDLFLEFIRTSIKRVRDQALAVSVALAAPVAEARDNTNRPLKPRNPDLYYGHLHMEYYYFCQQCEDHFEVARSLGHKRVSLLQVV